MSNETNWRGYAYQAFKAIYYKQLGWGHFAAAAKAGMYPSLGEYLDECLKVYDSLAMGEELNKEKVQDITNTVVKHMSGHMKEEFRGYFRYTKNDDGAEWVTPKYDLVLDEDTRVMSDLGFLYSGSVGENIPYEESGYEAVEDADVMRMRMRMVAERLSDEDMDILMSIVSGEYDSFNAACGGDRSKATSLSRRIKRQCADLMDMEGFVYA